MARFDEQKMLLVLKPGLHMTRAGSITSRIWNLMPLKRIDVSLNRLFEQPRQNTEGGSPAEPGGGSIM